jgi:hypothetical protein
MEWNERKQTSEVGTKEERETDTQTGVRNGMGEWEAVD